MSHAADDTVCMKATGSPRSAWPSQSAISLEVSIPMGAAWKTSSSEPAPGGTAAGKSGQVSEPPPRCDTTAGAASC